MSIVKTTLNTRENIKTEISQQPKLIWPKACLEKNFEKWTPSQPSAHICACYIHNQSVDWSRHLCESNDELFIRSNGDHVSILVSPGYREDLLLQLRKHKAQLLLQVGQAGAHFLVHHKPSQLIFCFFVFQDNFDSNIVNHLDLSLFISCSVLLKL